MSITDPQARWWNRDSTRTALAYAMWAAGSLLALAGTWNLMRGDESSMPRWTVPLSAALPVLLLIGGALLSAFGTAGRRSLRPYGWALSGYFIAVGAGGLLAGASSAGGLTGTHLVFGILAVGGLLAIVVIEAVRRRTRRVAALRERVRRTGTVTSGTVTRARHFGINHQPVTRVTVRFTDAEGRSRWSTATLDGTLNVGEQVRVVFSPQDLPRRGAVVVSR